MTGTAVIGGAAGPPLAGGVVIIGLVALLVRRRGFLAYDATHPTP